MVHTCISLNYLGASYRPVSLLLCGSTLYMYVHPCIIIIYLVYTLVDSRGSIVYDTYFSKKLFTFFLQLRYALSRWWCLGFESQ